jgi:hypothetical protein
MGGIGKPPGLGAVPGGLNGGTGNGGRVWPPGGNGGGPGGKPGGSGKPGGLNMASALQGIDKIIPFTLEETLA